MLKRLGARLRALATPAPQAAPAAEGAAPRAAILDQYVRSAPSSQNALDIFKGEWWSSLPAPHSALQAGQLPLFDDPRIHWAIEALGGVQGKKVLELGPLEGGHTYVLERAGAQSILAIEASTKAFLKCLVVKELLDLQRSRFVLGDFEEYLRAGGERFDAAIASGVVYHVRNPVELIHNLARVCDRLFIWTQYYIKERLDAIPHMAGRFPGSQEAEYAGFRHTQHRYFYGDFLNTSRFAGGSEEHSHWLSRDDLLGALRHAGLTEIVIGAEEITHANGPAISLLASRPSPAR
jgi:hypothetical protein